MTTITEIVGVVLPLMAIAGSAVAYVVKFYQERRDGRDQRFSKLLSDIDQPRKLAGKLAAIYELRSFPEHKDFIVRFCSLNQKYVEGETAESIRNEMRETVEFFKN